MDDPYGSMVAQPPGGGNDPYASMVASPKAAKPPSAPVTAGGVAKAAGSGFLGGLLSDTPQGAEASGAKLGIDATGWLANHLGIPKEKVDSAVAALQQARQQAGFRTPDETQDQAHLYHAPQNEAERIASVAGAMAPNAIIPEGAAAKAASVILPTAGSEGARYATEKAGGGPVAQGVASVVGGALGGVAAGMRTGAPRPSPSEPTAGIDPQNPVTPTVANAAQRYVASRASKPDAAMVDAAAAGKPVTAAEMLGASGRTALGALARRSGATADTLGPQLAERTAGMPDRMQGDFEQATGISPAAVRGDFEAMINARRNGPVKGAYDQALSIDNKPDMTASGGGSQTLSQLMEEPEVAKAFGFAKRKLGSAATYGDGTPTAEALDLTKKYLNQMVATDPVTKQPLTTGEAGIGNTFTMDTGKAFTGALREAIPGYGDALDQAGEYLSLQRAHDMGAKLITSPRHSVADVQATVGKLSDAEKEAFRGGVAARLFDLSQNGRLNPKTVSTPNVMGKLSAALGPGAAKQFFTGAAQEKLLADQARRMMPGTNSPTAEYGAEMAAQDQAHPMAQAGAEFLRDTAVGTAATFGNVGVAAKIALVKQLAKGARGIASNAMAGAYGMPEAVRDEAGRILMSEMTPQQVRAYTALPRGVQDAKLRIMLRNPNILSRPSFLASAAGSLSAGLSNSQGRKSDRQPPP